MSFLFVFFHSIWYWWKAIINYNILLFIQKNSTVHHKQILIFHHKFKKKKIKVYSFYYIIIIVSIKVINYRIYVPHPLRAWASMTLHSYQLIYYINKTTEEVKWISHHFIQLQSIIKTKISKFVISWKRKTFWSTKSAKLQWKIIFIFNFIQFCESQALSGIISATVLY